MFLDSRVVIPQLLDVQFAEANNQWNIAAELADDPMDSAFARALTGGIKGVAMVSRRKAVLLFVFEGFGSCMFVQLGIVFRTYYSKCLVVQLKRSSVRMEGSGPRGAAVDTILGSWRLP